MADQRTIRSIAWQQVFPSLRILGAVRIALNFKALLLAALAVTGTVAGWRVLDQLFAEPADPAAETEMLVRPRQAPEGEIANYRVFPWERSVPWRHASDGPLGERLTTLDGWYVQSPLLAAWTEISVPFRRMYNLYDAPTFEDFMYLLCCSLWSLLIWSFFGGALSRQAAVAFARQENVSLGALARFVHGKLGSYFAAPLFPILGAALIAAGIALVGLLLRLDVGVAVAGIALWPLVLFGGFLMTFLLLGLFFGFPLMWSAISAEGTDAFGALSHSYSYVYQRPLRYLGYAVLAALVGVLGWLLVTLFVDWILTLSDWAITWGSGTARLGEIRGPEAASTLTETGALFMQFWTNCLVALAVGFIFSYFWTSTTVIYFLLRRLVDGAALDEVFMPGEAARHGLPPLKTGPDGVPQVDENSGETSAPADAKEE